MRFTKGSRASRLLIPALVAVLAFSAGSVFVASGSTVTQTYFACASSKGDLTQMRVDSPPTCNANQTLVSWESGSTPPSVSWQDLQNVPHGFADGIDNVGSGVATDVDCWTDCIDTREIQDRSITGDDISTQQIDATHLQEQSVWGGPGGHIADMSIMEADLADASVPTNKLRVNANQLWADADLIMPGGGATVHQLSLWLPTDGPHLVELNAYANVTCVCDIGSGSAPVSWVFLVDGQPVSPEYQGTVDAAHPLFIPMSLVGGTPSRSS